MSSPPMSPLTDPSSGPPNTRKRTFSDARVDELETMRPLKLTAVALALQPSASDSRALASEKSGSTAPTPASSQESDNAELSDLDKLELAFDYLEKRIKAAAAEREERYNMLDESPKGSQNSFIVSYSQDSKLSGDEPPTIREVAKIVLTTLPEHRIQMLFPVGNEDDIDRRVGVAVGFLDTDLKFLHDLIEETMEVMREIAL